MVNPWWLAAVWVLNPASSMLTDGTWTKLVKVLIEYMFVVSVIQDVLDIKEYCVVPEKFGVFMWFHKGTVGPWRRYAIPVCHSTWTL